MSSEPITFKSGDETLVGQLYLPSRRAHRTWPTIIVTGSWTTVKEQMPAVYAKRLAEAGFAAFIFDYTSLFGGTPVTQAATDLIAGWQGLLPGFEATQHVAGPVLVDLQDDRANARCAVTAVHRIGTTYWTVGGHYAMELLRRPGGWAISSLTLHTVWVQGDTGLVDQAQACIASHQGRAAAALTMK